MKRVDFKKNNGLVPVIIQDHKNLDVYMLGYMNQDALELTKKTRNIYFWSRSRKKLWMKGEMSGNRLQVCGIFIDCDNDTLLIKVQLLGKGVCHTGNKSCFFKSVREKKL